MLLSNIWSRSRFWVTVHVSWVLLPAKQSPVCQCVRVGDEVLYKSLLWSASQLLFFLVVVEVVVVIGGGGGGEAAAAVVVAVVVVVEVTVVIVLPIYLAVVFCPLEVSFMSCSSFFTCSFSDRLRRAKAGPTRSTQVNRKMPLRLNPVDGCCQLKPRCQEKSDDAEINWWRWYQWRPQLKEIYGDSEICTSHTSLFVALKTEIARLTFFTV